jgi:Txe/YoeB family toxin of Txe-Axe toxin-antitoxin module
LKRIPQNHQKRIVSRVEDLAKNGTSAEHLVPHLLQLKGDFAGNWRAKVGDHYRVVFAMEPIPAEKRVQDGPTETLVVKWVGTRENVPYD